MIGLLEAFSSEPFGFNDSDVGSLELLAELILGALKPEDEERFAESAQAAEAELAAPAVTPQASPLEQSPLANAVAVVSPAPQLEDGTKSASEHNAAAMIAAAVDARAADVRQLLLRRITRQLLLRQPFLRRSLFHRSLFSRPLLYRRQSQRLCRRRQRSPAPNQTGNRKRGAPETAPEPSIPQVTIPGSCWCWCW